jgi:hypothetical protein
MRNFQILIGKIVDNNRIDDAYKNWFDYFYSTVKKHITNIE